MARLNINLGTTANDRTGDPLRTAFDKVNQNFVELYARTGDDIQIPALAGNDGKVLTTNGTTLSWNVNSSLVNGSASIALNIDGTLTLPNGATQRDTGSINCQPGVDTVVFTSSQEGIQTIKLLLQVEGTVTGNDLDTQSCEMIVAKGFRGPTVAASVYGVVHSSVAPLATFTAQWNVLTSRVEITCRPTSLTNNVNIKTFATEITTSD
jgi:hypothetical protein